MRQKKNTTDRSIKDKSTIMRDGCVGISFAMALLLMQIGCNSHSPKQQLEPNLSFIDTISKEWNAESFRREIGMMKDSLKEGLWITVYPDGGIASIDFFEKGKWNGPSKYFHRNGQLALYREIRNGIFHGKSYGYLSNGVMISSSHWLNDKPDGIFETYHDNGELDYAVEYKEGEYIRTVYGNPPIIEE